MKLLIGLACAMLVGCSVPVDGGGCEAPSDATYKTTVQSDDAACSLASGPVHFVDGTAHANEAAHTLNSGDMCQTTVTTGRGDRLDVEWDAAWLVGAGTYVVDACRYTVQLERQ